MSGHGSPRGDRALHRGHRFASGQARRRIDLHRAARSSPELPQYPEHHLGGRHYRQRGDPPWVWPPRRERHVRRGLPGVRHHVYRTVARDHPVDGRQGAGAGDGEAGRRARRAGQRGSAARGGRGAGAGRRHRLPGDGQGGGRRRRTRDEDRPGARRPGPRLCDLPVGGPGGLRVPPPLPREIRGGGAPRRGPGARRQKRHAHPPGRARLLHPTPTSEARGGVPRSAPSRPRRGPCSARRRWRWPMP